MIEWFTRNHVAANLLMVSIVCAGIYYISYVLPLEAMPSFEAEVVTITVTRPAANPEDMATGIASKVEEAISDLPEIEKISSRSSEGVTTVTAKIFQGEDAESVLNDVKSRIDALNTLPGDAERPVIKVPMMRRDAISLVVYGDLDERELNQVARRVRDDLIRNPNITQVEIEGVRPYEISIEVAEARLREHGLTLQDVANVIKGQSLDLSAGRIRSASGEVLLRAKTQAYDYEDFSNIVIKRNSDGSLLKLKDIADINDGFDENVIVTRYNGRRAAVINISRVGKESVIQVSAALKEYVEENKNLYPPSVQFSVWNDNSVFINERLGTLADNALQGAVLVIILLSLFLHPSVALWVVVGIPVCFLGASAMMPSMGVTINSISVFGFILVLGIVVDDAIVTGENIYRHFRSSEDGLTAAINGTKEVATPVVFGVLTTIAALSPLAMLPGGIGTFLSSLALVAIAVLCFSLVESKLILPAHLKGLKDPVEGGFAAKLMSLQRKVANGLELVILRYYKPILISAMRHRYLTVMTFVAVGVITVSTMTTGWTRIAFFPNIERETVSIELIMQEGTSVAITDDAVERVESVVTQLQQKYRHSETGVSLIDNVLSTVGATSGGATGRSNVGRVRFSLLAREKRETDIANGALFAELRGLIGPIAGMDSLHVLAHNRVGGRPIDVQLEGSDTQQLKQVAEQIKAELALYSGVNDIEDTLSDGKRELQILLKPEAEILGFNLEQVTRQVREAFYGNQAQRIQRNRDDIRVLVRYPEQERLSLNRLQELLITAPGGAEARFSDIATISWGISPTDITRVNMRTAINVQADYDVEQVNSGVLMAGLETFLDELMQQYPALGYSLEGEAYEAREAGSAMLLGLLFVLFAIYGLLAIPFGSYLQPLIVMSIIPFAVIGAIAGHWLLGKDISILSIMGGLALIGIIVNDSLVLVDYINKECRKGVSLHEAVLNAGIIRFRPIFLTSMTTFLGLLPLLMEESTQAQFLIPMATSLSFGVLFGTFITLLLIPCHFLILEDIKALFSKKVSDSALIEERIAGA